MGKKTPLRRSTQFKELLQGLESIHLDSKYSDLTIACGDKEYAVHRCIVCPRSDFLTEACGDGFGGSAKNRVVIEEKPALIKGVIDYLYTLDYHMEVHTPETDLSQEPDGEEAQDSPNKPDSINEDKATACNTLSLYISMYSLADRLLIHGLKALSKEKFEKELARRWLDPSTFSHAVSEIYNSTPESDRGLRDLIVNVTMDNLVILRTGAKTMDSTVAGNGEESGPVAFPDSLARSVPQFSSDLAVEMMNRTVADWNRHGTCKPNWVQ